jgi:methylmalonyl-CoA mutase N-terminal domain/subunit
MLSRKSTNGRSLHAEEIAFNDIRTTLQALISTYDNTDNTNAYDEAITTSTEESVRRAMAIQLIINREWGLAKNENPNQGAFIIDEPTDLVEEAALKEFEVISERGGVLGAMETGTSAAISRKGRCTTSTRNTTARIRSSASTASATRKPATRRRRSS